jgi:acetyl esterase
VAVTTVKRRYDGGIHGFMTMPMLDIAQRARAQVSEDLNTLLASAPTSPTAT